MDEVRLREMQAEDVAFINRWRNEPGTIGRLGAVFRFVAPEVDSAWYEGYLKSRSNNIRLVIEAGSPSRVVGAVYLLQIDWVARSAEFALWLGDVSSRGKGIGYRASTLALSHGFDDLNLYRIHLTVLEDNIPAIRLYEKLGFRAEGILVDAVFKEGGYKSLVAMALLEPQYRARTSPDGV